MTDVIQNNAMLVHHSYYSSGKTARSLLAKARSLALSYHECRPYESLNSWKIHSYPHLILMEGRHVKSHDDGDRFWQPFVVLSNPENRYSFKGSRQRVRSLIPQAPGSLLVLDIGKQHEATGRSNEVWSALCWNPNGCVPHQSDYSLEAAVEAARTAFDEFERYAAI